MSKQLTLELDAESKLDKQFADYHAANPQVYETLVRLARRMRSRGRRRIGIKMLWETMRYELMLETNDAEGYKLNNNYPSRYARLIMQQEPDLTGFFETRELRS